MPRPSLSPIAAGLDETVPFVGPEAIARRTGIALRARIGANESPFGPAPSVLAAMTAAARESWHYGDPENHDLRMAIAAHLGIPFANVMPGEGVDAILGMAVRLFAAPGSTVVTSLGGYPTFNYHIHGYGAQMHTVPYIGDREDVDGLARAARETQAAMVYLANPDNPMGSWWDAASVERFIAAVPETTMIVLDEAYGEFAPPGTLPAFDMDRPNLLRMRTFSKAYGLAGLRVGYGIGQPDVIDLLNRVRQPFNVTNVGLAAAVAALADQDFVRRSAELNAAGLKQMETFFDGAGIGYIRSYGNFIAFRAGDGAAVNRRLLEQGVIVRPIAGYAMPEWLRVSIGLETENARFIDALKKALA